jgi:acyl-CoA thioesterase-1
MLAGILVARVMARLAFAGAIFACAIMAHAATARAEIKIVAIGDSNLDVPHISKKDMYPAQLERVLRERGHQVSVTNAGLRGDTTQGVLERLNRHVPAGTDIALVGVGANDTGVFKIPRNIWTANLTIIVKRLRERGIEVLLFGVGNLNNETCCFGKAVANETGALFYRHFQDGLTDDYALHSEKIKPNPTPDGPVDKNATKWHLNEKGNILAVERTLPLVEELIARVEARAAAGAKGSGP